MASAGIDRNTGQVLRGWPHVVQSLGVIFSTRFGERVMRRYFGSNIPALLGENMVPDTFIRFYSAVAVALLQEPRVGLMRITPLAVTRGGQAEFLVEFEYRPRGHLGDATAESIRSVKVGASSAGRIEVQSA